MDPQTETQEISQIGKLEDIMSKIESHCTNDEEGGIFLFKTSIKGSEGTSQEVTLSPEEHAANLVYDMLMCTLSDIGYSSVEEAKKGGPLASEYFKIAKAMDAMSQVTRALADDQIPLIRNVQEEQHRKQLGDTTVHSYTAQNVQLGDRIFDGVKVFIREAPYIRPTQLNPANNKYARTTKEYQQPRMKIVILPQDERDGAISFRVDQEDLSHGMEITFDIDVRNNTRDENLIDRLTFPSAEQREGHHFSSTYTTNALNLSSFTPLLAAFTQKFDVVASQSSSPSQP